ncbi:DUF6116 family protein [Microbulbifer hydrolyticus]|uniref:Uncharacterized protein n=1 Tax=Microbulbifer hydrolyticus TaxID=48074 RepID=A0AA89PAV8_9GAMM|nr:DUF6116 family protein [Microbulbifer hydrolyticus]MBB5210785.1 hypothetical protein [Microbulbifer hydrolyticus]
MKRVLPSALVGWFLRYAHGLKHPQLFKWICAFFLIDLIIPDLVPFVDEILLGLGTLFLASWKKSGSTTESSEGRQEKVVTGSAEKMTGAGETPESQRKQG